MKPSEFVMKELEGKSITKEELVYIIEPFVMRIIDWNNREDEKKEWKEEWNKVKKSLSKLNNNYISVEEHEKERLEWIKTHDGLAKAKNEIITKLEKEIKELKERCQK